MKLLIKPDLWLGNSFLLRGVAAVLVVVAACFALLLLSLRYWVLPDIERYREDIAQAISRASGQAVTIGSISAEWDGLHPHMMLHMIRFHDDEGNATLLLHKLEGTLSWLSILHGNFHFREIRIDQPDLVVRRDSKGIISVAGFALSSPEENENGFSDWLLQQEHVIIKNASILWQDDQRSAPELELLVNLRLENRGDHHRFGILAVPPAELAKRLDVRGDLTGKSLGIPERLRGRLFVKIDQGDIASWRPWLPLPGQIKLDRGSGGLRMWAQIDGTDIKKLSGDMRLRNVRVQLGDDLPQLDLLRLEGRAGWQKVHDGNREGDKWYVRHLYYALRNKQPVEPVNFSLQLMQHHGEKPGGGKMSASALNLEMLSDLVDYLPVNQTLRQEVSKASARGDLQSLLVNWSGEWIAPVRFSVKGSFDNLSMSQVGKIPSFGGMSGNIDATEKRGTLNLRSRHAKLELPDLFPEPLIADTLIGHVNWSSADRNSTMLKLSNVSFSNRFASGSASGTYHLRSGGVDTIDMAGKLTNADARYLARFISGMAGSSNSSLANSVVAGRFSDVRIHAKGPLEGFPSGKQDWGLLRAQARASGVTLDNLPGWPRIENISGNLLLQHNRVEFDSGQASISGTRVTRGHLHIPDIASTDAILLGQIEASGPTQQFFNIATQYSGEAFKPPLLDSAKFTGEGRLWLTFSSPLSSGSTKLSGNYQFIDNQLYPGSRMPGLKSINGMLGFNNSGIKIQNVIARFLGGPVFINAGNTEDGGFHLTASGTLNPGNINEITDGKTAEIIPLLVKHLRGSTGWRASMQVNDKTAGVIVESSLEGLSSNFPAPFAKSSVEEVPFRFERIATGPDKDEISITYGRRAAARINRTRKESGEYQADRGVVAFGAALPATAMKAGVTVMGTLPLLDADQWLGQLKQFKLQSNVGTEASIISPVNIHAVNIQLGVLNFLGRQLTDVTLSASKEDGVWRSTVTGKEIGGNVSWDPSGRGKIAARLSKVAVSPASTTSKVAPRYQEKDLPALDVVVENFSIGEKHLGQLELVANHQEQNWRIEKLNLSTSDSSLSIKGLWDREEKREDASRVQATLFLESNDIGKFLTRLGLPERIKRGSGRLEGSFSWNGVPQSIDYATLTGSFRIAARNGQFPKFEPGIGRLFGIFDLRALPRRIILDFHDIFSEGFGFNEISADIKVNRGIAATNDLVIEGPAARIMMNGRINLEEESQDLHMKVVPSLGLATPVVGVASLIVSKALQKPASPNEYHITGEWTDPLVTKIAGRAARLEERD